MADHCPPTTDIQELTRWQLEENQRLAAAWAARPDLAQVAENDSFGDPRDPLAAIPLLRGRCWFPVPIIAGKVDGWTVSPFPAIPGWAQEDGEKHNPPINWSMASARLVAIQFNGRGALATARRIFGGATGASIIRLLEGARHE
jgi:hypothetical protein